MEKIYIKEKKRNYYKKNCELCNKEYLSQKKDGKTCSRSCSSKLIHKMGLGNTKNMVISGRDWHNNNPEKSKEMCINNLPKDNNLDKNGNWKGGKTKEYREYRIKNYSEYYRWKKRCKSRDNHKCKICESTQKLQVHHIIPISEYRETAWVDMNGVTLCKDCHYENDEVWKDGKRYQLGVIGSKDIIIRFIRPEFQEYKTCGNYKILDNGAIIIFITKQINHKYNLLIALHELIEVILTQDRGIKEEDIMDFDLKWEKGLQVEDEPGNCKELNGLVNPYYKEHRIAENFERLLSEYLNIDWLQYEKDLIL